MSRYSNKTSITESERLQLIGLMALGAEARKRTDAVSDAMAEILGEKPREGYADDFALGGSIDELLERCGLTVEPDEQTTTARHTELHVSLDELLSLFLMNNPDKTPSSTSVMELAEWSNRQLGYSEGTADA